MTMYNSPHLLFLLSLFPLMLESHIISKRQARCPVFWDRMWQGRDRQCPGNKRYHCFENGTNTVVAEGCFVQKLCKRGAHPEVDGNVMMCSLCRTGFQPVEGLETNRYQYSYCTPHSDPCNARFGESLCREGTREMDRACTCDAMLGFSPKFSGENCDCFTPQDDCSGCKFTRCPAGRVKNDEGYCQPEKTIPLNSSTSTTQGPTESSSPKMVTTKQPDFKDSHDNLWIIPTVIVPVIAIIIIIVLVCKRKSVKKWWAEKRQKSSSDKLNGTTPSDNVNAGSDSATNLSPDQTDRSQGPSSANIENGVTEPESREIEISPITPLLQGNVVNLHMHVKGDPVIAVKKMGHASFASNLQQHSEQPTSEAVPSQELEQANGSCLPHSSSNLSEANSSLEHSFAEEPNASAVSSPEALSHKEGEALDPSALPPSLPEASAPPPSLPEASAPPPSLPEASAPPPSLPEASAPPPSLPEASAPPSSLPEVSAPALSLPEASAPPPSSQDPLTLLQSLPDPPSSLDTDQVMGDRRMDETRVKILAAAN